jgi:hypothetical protein
MTQNAYLDALYKPFQMKIVSVFNVGKDVCIAKALKKINA